jgi:hypothetical protein
MKTIKRTIILATTILSLSSFANEGNLKSAFNYDYVSVELGSLTIDGLSGSFDYTGLSGAVSISDNYYISLNNIQDRESGGDISISSYGLGSHYALNDTTDLVSEVSFIDIQASSGGVSASGDGVGLSLGIKNKIHENINIGAAISYTTIEGVSDTAFTFGAEFEMPITEELSFGAELVSDGDISTKSIGLKYNL